MEITGFIRHALEAKSGVSQKSGNPWMSRDYVLEIPGQYPRHFVFTVFGEDKIKQFALRKDEEVTVQFDIDAREYKGRWFNSVNAWGVIRPGQRQPAPNSSAQQQQSGVTAAPPPPQQQQTDDLPF